MNMCDLLMANFETLCRNYKLEETMNIAGAMILTNEHETADIERMKACYNIIKRSEGIFSVYRNYMRIPVMTKMSMSDDPENYFENLKAIKDELDRERFLKSEYSVIAAMVSSPMAVRRSGASRSCCLSSCVSMPDATRPTGNQLITRRPSSY